MHKESQAKTDVHLRDLVIRKAAFQDLTALESVWSNSSNESKYFFRPGFFKKEMGTGYFNPIWRLSLMLSTLPILNELFLAMNFPNLSWICLTLCADDKIAGFAYVRIKRRGVGVLGIFLGDKIRGEGAGRELLLAILKEASSMGLSQIYLRVFESNHKARRLFESIGFEYIEGSAKVKIKKRTMTSLPMILNVKNNLEASKECFETVMQSFAQVLLI